MAKSALNRYHAERLLAKAAREIKLSQCHYKLDSLSYGKVFKSDVWDCRRAKCKLCHWSKFVNSKARRLEIKKETRREYLAD